MGGGIFNAGTLVVTTSTITGNIVKDTTMFGMQDFRGGGGVANLGSGIMTVTEGSISDNHGRYGGGIANSDS